MKEKQNHPLAGAILRMLAAGIYYIFAIVIAGILTGRKSGIFIDLIGIFFLVLLLLFHKIRHRKELTHFFSFAGTGKGVLLGWSMLLVGAIVAVSNFLQGAEIGNIPYAFFMGFVPGFSEEVICRILPLSLPLQRGNDSKTLWKISLATSFCFGLFHGGNLLIGADFVSTVIQVLYAIGIGMLLSGIYIKTRSLWTCVILHTWLDAASFFIKNLQESNGVLKQAHTGIEIIILLLFTIAFYVNAFMVFKTKTSD